MLGRKRSQIDQLEGVGIDLTSLCEDGVDTSSVADQFEVGQRKQLAQLSLPTRIGVNVSEDAEEEEAKADLIVGPVATLNDVLTDENVSLVELMEDVAVATFKEEGIGGGDRQGAQRGGVWHACSDRCGDARRSSRRRRK